MLRIAALTTAAIGLLGCDAAPISVDVGERTYEVTLTNLSDAQPLSPGVFVLHDNTFSLFAGGEAAPAGIQARRIIDGSRRGASLTGQGAAQAATPPGARLEPTIVPPVTRPPGPWPGLAPAAVSGFQFPVSGLHPMLWGTPNPIW